MNTQDSPTLTLDANHVYRVGERVYPGVTTVIRACDAGWAVDPWYLERGQRVHQAIHLYLQRRLDWTTVHDSIKGRVESVAKFLADTKLTPLAVEVKLASARYQFAGTLDFYGDRTEILKGGKQYVLADWKGSLSPHCQPQLGAYAQLLQESGQNSLDLACAVETRDDGTYKIKWFDTREIRRATQVFLAMLTTYGWKVENKIINPKPKGE